MTDQGCTVCGSCGKRTACGEQESNALAKGYRTCSRCETTVCSNCIDWTAGSGSEIVCSKCSGRTAPPKSGCD